MPERDTAQAQLERILHLLPMAGRPGGAGLAEIARALQVPVDRVLSDISQLTARCFYHPAGSVEEFQILVERERVRLEATSEFLRPVRLTPGEALALGLGLRALAAEAAEERRTALLALADRLETDLVVPPPQMRPRERPPAPGEVAREEVAADLWEVQEAGAPQGPGPHVEEPLFSLVAGPAPPSVRATHYAGPPVPEPPAEPPPLPYHLAMGDDDLRWVLADGARERRRCRILYLKPGAGAPTERVIAPYTLLYGHGLWYVVGEDDRSGAPRTFRLDRVLAAALTEDGFEIPADFRPTDYLAAARGDLQTGVTAVVRYSPRIAGWIGERFGVEPAASGSVEVRHTVADPRWLVRHVLQYGAEAEVLEPAELRDQVRRSARQLAGAA